MPKPSTELWRRTAETVRKWIEDNPNTTLARFLHKNKTAKRNAKDLADELAYEVQEKWEIYLEEERERVFKETRDACVGICVQSENMDKRGTLWETSFDLKATRILREVKQPDNPND